MAVRALYRRWRPQSFDDVIGQTHVTQTLRNEVAHGRLVHAYLFAGPRGTGKTSVARILAKAVNCTSDGDKPCNECRVCQAVTEGRSLDLIEIDAASNTGVDDVRDLREKIGFAPNEARYKVYVIDEVHMLSRAAFNALLKTLEEPPPHAMFVLATTEPHKIPDTIVSRCQRHDFRRVAVDDIVGKLERVCRAEGIRAEPAALTLVARSATGSMRDAESLLDQLMAASDSITVAAVRDTIGAANIDAVAALVDAMIDRDTAAGLRLLHEALDRGTDPLQLRVQLLEHLRGMLLVQTGVAAELLELPDEGLALLRRHAESVTTRSLAATIRRFEAARPSADRGHPALGLELALVETVLAGGDSASPAAGAAVGSALGSAASSPAAPAAEPPMDSAAEPARSSAGSSAGGPPAEPAAETTIDSAPGTARRPAAGPPARPTGRRATGPAAAPTAATTKGSTTPGSADQGPDALAAVAERWDTIVAAVAKRDKNTAALLKDCKPLRADADSVTLGFFYDFHCQRVSEPERQAMVASAFEEVLQRPRTLHCRVIAPSEDDRAARPRSRSEHAKKDPVVRHAIEEFGARITSIEPPDANGD